jgi:hypothetical protein
MTRLLVLQRHARFDSHRLQGRQIPRQRSYNKQECRDRTESERKYDGRTRRGYIDGTKILRRR